MDTVNQKKFEKTKKEAEEYYKNIGEIYCPYFQNKVIFNARGLEHLKFKGREKARLITDQYMRLRLISLAPEITKKSHTLQGISETKHFEYEKRSSRWENILKQVIYYEFIAVIKKTRIKVIIKQVGDGPKFFWSLIPFWRMNKNNNKRMLHNGNPEID